MAFLLKGIFMKKVLKGGAKKGAKTGPKRVGLASTAVPIIARGAVPIYTANKLEDQFDEKVKQVLPYALAGIGLITGTVLIITLSR